MTQEVERRARIHAALGDPVRLAIVDDLDASDRSPSELARRFELATNLLAHHLDVLEEAHLIERFVSSGDRRRRYVRLRRTTLDHLQIDRVAGGSDLADGVVTMFVCSQNSARSQLAAALWTAKTGLEATSAGTHPAERVAPGAVAAARRAGLDLTGAVPTLLEQPPRTDLVVTVCDRAHEELVALPSWRHWSLADPVESGTDAAFDEVIAELERRIDALAS
ncbi:MAG: helix-turn-helix domain-containing protein [Ilumatobacteraceae bacterium]